MYSFNQLGYNFEDNDKIVLFFFFFFFFVFFFFFFFFFVFFFFFFFVFILYSFDVFKVRLILLAIQSKPDTYCICTNREDPDEVAHYEPSHYENIPNNSI